VNFEDLIGAQVHITRGSVYLWYEYPFVDSDDVRDKYWITLNCKINDFPINAILPTSQWNNHHYSREENLIDTVIIERGESNFFNKKTVIDLKNILIEDEIRIRDGIENNFLQYQGELESDIFLRIESAIQSAITISTIDKNEYLCLD